MRPRLHIATIVLLLAPALAGAAEASESGSLRGSAVSMRVQHRVAEKNHFTFARNEAQLRRLVQQERLDRVEPSAELRLEKVSYPYARAAVVRFLERLAAEYRVAAEGAPLIVTSLTRPESKQPRNAHALSVHPAGMAVDLRIPSDSKVRAWLEGRLLVLEGKGVLDVTRERNPAHYHVAVYPEKYDAYARALPPAEHFVEPAPVAAPVSAPAVSEPSASPSAPRQVPVLMLVMIGALSAVFMRVAAVIARRRFARALSS